jgi:hypothetical protein
MIRGKRNLLIIAAIIVVATAAGLIFYYKTQTAWVDSPPYRRVSESPTQILVVVYSRTGNTMSAAKEAASYFDADLLQILAPQYPIGKYNDARNAEHSRIDQNRLAPSHAWNKPMGCGQQ